MIISTGALVVLLSHGLGRMSYSVILPSMKKDLALSYTEAGFIGTANFVGYLFFSVLSGLIAFHLGARKIIFFSLFVMGISLFFTGLSNSFGSALFWRFITGVSNGGAYIPTMALPALWFAKKKRGLASGLLTMGTGMGLFLTGFFLPRLMGQFEEEGWRQAWFLMGLIVFTLSFLCFMVLRDRPQDMGLSMYGGEEEGQSGVPYSFREVLADKEIWHLGTVYFMYGVSYIIYLTFFVAFLNQEIGLPLSLSGNIFAILGLLSIVSGLIWGFLSDLLGRRGALSFAYLALSLSCLLLVFLKNTVGFYLSSTLFGLTISSVPAIVAARTADITSGRFTAFALGFTTIFFGIGQSLGPALGGYIKDSTGTFFNAFIFSAFVSTLGSALSLTIRR